MQDSRRPLTLSLSPSDGERVAFRPGEGNRGKSKNAGIGVTVHPQVVGNRFPAKAEHTLQSLHESQLRALQSCFDSRAANHLGMHALSQAT